MLEQYFLKPDTVDRIQNCWLGEPIERYVALQAEKGYAASHIRSHVPILRQFAEATWHWGARSWEELPDYIEPFVARWIAERGIGRSANRIRQLGNEIRGPIEQLVSLVVPSFVGRGRPRVTRDPFLKEAPGFFTYLREERGLREASILHYGHTIFGS